MLVLTGNFDPALLNGDELLNLAPFVGLSLSYAREEGHRACGIRAAPLGVG